MSVATKGHQHCSAMCQMALYMEAGLQLNLG